MLEAVYSHLALFLAPDQCDRAMTLIREHVMHYRDFDAELLTPDQVSGAIKGLQEASAGLLALTPAGGMGGQSGTVGKILQAHQLALAVLQTELIALQLQAKMYPPAAAPAENGAAAEPIRSQVSY